MLWLVMLKFALCPAAPCSSIPSSHQTAGDHLEILSVANAALPLDAVENVLPILQMQDRALEFFEFFFDAHHACPVFDAFSNDRVGTRFSADYATTGGETTDRPRVQYPKIRRPHWSLD